MNHPHYKWLAYPCWFPPWLVPELSQMLPWVPVSLWSPVAPDGVGEGQHLGCCSPCPGCCGRVRGVALGPAPFL